MLTKENIITTINNLTEPITFDDVLDKMLFLDKIEKGIEESDKGLVITDDDLNNRIQAWLV